MPVKTDRTSRPENWKELTERLDRGEITQVEACKLLGGIHRNKLNAMLNWDNPNRRDRRKEHARAMGKANKKTTVYLQREFSDATLCKMIRVTENCKKCPVESCNGEKKYRGLGGKLLAKVPISKESPNA